MDMDLDLVESPLNDSLEDVDQVVWACTQSPDDPLARMMQEARLTTRKKRKFNESQGPVRPRKHSSFASTSSSSSTDVSWAPLPSPNRPSRRRRTLPAKLMPPLPVVKKKHSYSDLSPSLQAPGGTQLARERLAEMITQVRDDLDIRARWEADKETEKHRQIEAKSKRAGKQRQVELVLEEELEKINPPVPGSIAACVAGPSKRLPQTSSTASLPIHTALLTKRTIQTAIARFAPAPFIPPRTLNPQLHTSNLNPIIRDLTPPIRFSPRLARPRGQASLPIPDSCQSQHRLSGEPGAIPLLQRNHVNREVITTVSNVPAPLRSSPSAPPPPSQSYVPLPSSSQRTRTLGMRRSLPPQSQIPANTPLPPPSQAQVSSQIPAPKQVVKRAPRQFRPPFRSISANNAQAMSNSSSYLPGDFSMGTIATSSSKPITSGKRTQKITSRSNDEIPPLLTFDHVALGLAELAPTPPLAPDHNHPILKDTTMKTEVEDSKSDSSFGPMDIDLDELEKICSQYD